VPQCPKLATPMLSQEISWEGRLRNDLFCVEWDVNLNSINQSQTRSRRLRFGEHQQEKNAQRRKCKRVVTVVGRRLSAVKYEPLLHSRHSGRDRTGKVGQEIKK